MDLLKIKTAVKNIVQYRTLPENTTYPETYRVSAYRAEKFLKTLSKKSQELANTLIDIEVNDYYYFNEKNK